MIHENIKIVFEDTWMVIAFKPATMPCLPDKSGDLSLKVHLEKELNCQLFPVNRIDRPVFGLCLFAKYSEAAADLSALFTSGKIEKIYYAIVEGMVGVERGLLEDIIKTNSKSNKVELNPEDEEGKTALTSYRVKESSDRYTLLQVTPLTGRQHQIRAQLAAMGNPIKGDVKYGARRKNPDRSIDLLSYSLDFDHPYLKEKIKVTADIPQGTLWEFFKAAIENN